jgi:hypothetical protein
MNKINLLLLLFISFTELCDSQPFKADSIEISCTTSDSEYYINNRYITVLKYLCTNRSSQKVWLWFSDENSCNLTDEEVEKDKITIFKVEGDKNASDLYNFMINSQTNNVEWGLVQIGSANSGQNLLGTMNDTKGSGMGLYALEYGYTVRRSDHNHPLGTTTPSRDDVNNAKSISDKFPKAQFNIYVSPREPIPYNKKSPYIKPAYPGATYGNIQSAKKW